MPYRPGIISNGEDYVGETDALSRRLMQTKGAKFPVLYNFESEDELDEVESKMTKNDEDDSKIIAARRRYMAYWGAVKYQQDQGHQGHQHCQPTTRRHWSCGLCLCGKNMTMTCMCDSGKKMISPSRIVFFNSVLARQTRTLIYDINLGYEVPKAEKDLAPDWRELSWAV